MHTAECGGCERVHRKANYTQSLLDGGGGGGGGVEGTLWIVGVGWGSGGDKVTREEGERERSERGQGGRWWWGGGYLVRAV